jgi:hypothetical protein
VRFWTNTNMSEPDLIQTEVESGSPSYQAHSRATAAAFFARKDRLTRWCITSVVLSLSCAVLSMVIAIKASRREIQFVVMDPAGNVIVTPGRAFDEARELHTEQALLAASALLLRNPNGFDLPEVLQALFVGNALAQAGALKTAEAPEFQEKQIHQKPAVTRLEALEVRHNAVAMRVSGQLLRSGSFQQHSFTEVVPFVLDMALKHNPDLLRNRRQPTDETDR